jgi:hypothetical protein
MHIARVSGLVLLLVVAGLALASHAGSGYVSDQSVIQVVSTNVQGKNVYIPSSWTSRRCCPRCKSRS